MARKRTNRCRPCEPTPRAERAIWKLEQGRSTVRREGAGYVVTGPDGAASPVDDLAALVAIADAVYDRVWTGRKITPSA